MLIILLCYSIIFFIVFSFGKFFLNLFNVLCNQGINSSVFDTFLLGICPLLLVLSIISFFSPISEFVLFGFIFICSVYWILNFKKIESYWKKLLKSSFISKLNVITCISLLLVILTFILLSAWGVSNYDSACYHYQSVRWIEEFRAVPGLANIEERIGFNSNYMLISSLFTFRFILNDPIFIFQGLLAVCFFIWILSDVLRSNFELKRIVLFILFLFYAALSFLHFADSSTDIVPNLLVFYIVSKLVLYPQELKNNYILYAVLPLSIMTFKMSLAFFVLLTILILYILWKKRVCKSIVFIIIFCSLFLLSWFVRNIIISGYLIYPLYELDFFAVDWKLPKDIALAERNYINGSSLWMFKNVLANAKTLFTTPSLIYSQYYAVTLVFCVFALTPFTVFFNFLRKGKKERMSLSYFLYGVLFICFLSGFVSAPDFRFVGGVFFAAIYVTLCLVFNTSVITISSIGKYVVLICTCCFTILALQWLNLFTLDSLTKIENVLLKPRSINEKAGELAQFIEYDEYKINNDITIYITKHPMGLVYDILPAVPQDSNPDFIRWRFQSYKDLEARGNNLQDGFRNNSMGE